MVQKFELQIFQGTGRSKGTELIDKFKGQNGPGDLKVELTDELKGQNGPGDLKYSNLKGQNGPGDLH